MEELLGPAISSYSRAQAIEDGVLIAFPEMQEMAKEAGFTLQSWHGSTWKLRARPKSMGNAGRAACGTFLQC